MKGTSKVIMGATLVMVVSLAMVLGLVLVLLAELYCSLLLRRRQLRKTTSSTTGTAEENNLSPQPQQLQNQSSAPQPLRSFYAPGVLQAPRSVLFPAIHSIEKKPDVENQHSQLHQLVESETQEPTTTPHRIGVLSPYPSFMSVTSPTLQGGSSSGDNHGTCDGGGEYVVYISNPIYDNDAGRPSRADTPFETPDTSPSLLEPEGSSDEDRRDQSSTSSPSSVLNTPPLTPMKKLPAEACSVSLTDAGSLATSGSDSNTNNGLSSSSSGSPSTSPSW